MNIATKIFLLLLLVLLLFPGLFYAQENNSGAFGAPVLKFSSLAGEDAIFTGGRFGWIINKSIVLGGGIYSLVNSVKTGQVDPVSGQDVMLGLNCGGLEFEYIFFPESKFRASVEMFFAGCGVTFSVPDKSVAHTSYYSDNLLLWEPQVNIEYEIVDWLHIGTGVSYRIITSFDAANGISRDDLKGLSALITFKFGRY